MKKKNKKEKSIIFTIRRPIPPTGGPMRSKKQKEKQKRLKGKNLLKETSQE